MSQAQIAVEVAVVGGGLSGLMAARRLLQAGKSAVVLEASEHPGGRIGNGQVGGAVCELGGEWVSAFQTHINALLREFGLETFETFSTGQGTFVHDGKAVPYDTPFLPLPLTDLAEIAAAVVQFDLMAADVPPAAPWTAAEAASWDSQTMAGWLDSNILCEGARATLEIMVGGALCAAPRDLSLLHYLFLVASTGGAERLFTMKGGVLESRVVGGSGLVIDKLTAELGDRVCCNAAVRNIDQTGPQVVLTNDRGVVVADHVIVAMPPTMAGRITYDPPLPAMRDHLTQRTPMGWGIKVFASYPTPFWRDAGRNGFINNVDPGSVISGAFDNSPPDGSRGVLYGLIEGSGALAWGPRPVAERKAAVLEAFAACFGPQALEATDYLEQDWAGMPWIRGGATAAFGPGVWTGYGPALRAPVDRIHWAGTETAIEQWGSMDGAISAAERAVQEILQEEGATLGRDPSPAGSG
ncbi:MAG: FAD-dependent oxidoreductase [Chloroflexia bacterium]|nr:FAD-dependent oxidoreductase [Chloroflexia bacterium]